MSRTLYLVEMEAYDLAADVVRVLRFGSLGHAPATGTTHAIFGSPVHQYYDGRLLQPALMRRDIFGPAKTGGAAQVSYGEMTLANADGGLDYLAGYAFDGRRFRVLVGAEGTAYDAMTVALTGVLEQALVEINQVTFRIRDRMQEFQRPIQPTVYLGTNVLPDGLEGTANDIKGQQIPLIFGPTSHFWPDTTGNPRFLYQYAPDLVNTSKLIYRYQNDDNSAADTLYVYEGGIDLGAPYAEVSLAVLQSTAPPAGQWTRCRAAGLFRLGSAPVFPITCTLKDGDGGIENVLLDWAGLTSGEIDIADANFLNIFWGHVVEPGESIASVMDRACQANCAWWGFTRTGALKVRTLRTPSGSPAASFGLTEIISLAPQTSADEGRGVPVWKVRIGYARRYRLLSESELAGAVPSGERARVATAYTYDVQEDAGIKTAHPLATELIYDTSATMPGLAAHLLALYGVERTLLAVRVAATPATIAAVDLGAVVQITFPRLGLDAGKLFRVIGMQEDFGSGIIDLTLWG